MRAADTGAAPAAPAARGWRRLFVSDAGRPAGVESAPADLTALRGAELARARALRRHAERLAAVPSLAARLAELADRAEAAARRLGELGAGPGPTPAEEAAPAPTHWACLQRHAQETADLAERYLDAAAAAERERPEVARALTALRAACLGDRETLVWLLASWDPVVLERLAAAPAATSGLSPGP